MALSADELWILVLAIVRDLNHVAWRIAAHRLAEKVGISTRLDSVLHTHSALHTEFLKRATSMSGSDIKEEKRKRKRGEDGEQEERKSSKKSKKSKSTVTGDHAPVPEKKEKKSKKSKRPGDEVSATTPADNTESKANPPQDVTSDTNMQQDFVPLDDELMPRTDGRTGTALSGSSRKRASKDRKSKKQAVTTGDELKQALETVAAEEPASTDAKTGKKKEEKGKKGKKSRKVKEAPEAASNGVNGVAEIADAVPSEEVTKSKKENKPKKDKNSREKTDQVDASDEVQNGLSEPVLVERAETVSNGTEEQTTKSGKEKKSKKDKKDKKATNGVVPKADEGLVAGTTAEPAVESNERAEETGGEQNDDPQADHISGRKDRFIVFVGTSESYRASFIRLVLPGNLPYSATQEQIEAHFAKLKPFEIRMRTYKKDGRFMGTCFIEFDRFDHMQTALTKYHHSVFQDSGKKEGRKINVELR